MNITNRFGLPEAFVRAVEKDPYTRGNAEYSVSDLVAPPQLVQLSRRHADKLSEDAADRVWSLFGQAAHVVLERAGIEGERETRLFATHGGIRVSGQIDHYLDGVITDWKTTSAWTRVFEKDGLKPDWITQQNLYASLARDSGREVTGLRIMAIYRDWSASKAEKGGKYPQAPIEELTVPMLAPAAARSLMEARISLHVNGAILGDHAQEPCTDGERWKNKNGYARCEGYCPARPVCPQIKREKEGS